LTGGFVEMSYYLYTCNWPTSKVSPLRFS